MTAYRKIDVTADSLLGCRFFDGLEPEQRTRVSCLCEGRVYPKAAEVIRYMDTSQDVFFILAGTVEAETLTSDGRMVSFQSLGGGQMFGELSAIDGLTRSTSVFTSEQTTLLRMPGKHFKELVGSDARLSDRTMTRLCQLARHLCEKAFETMAYPVPIRVLLEIQREVRTRGGHRGSVTIDPAPTHNVIAVRVGTSREQATRTLGDLVKEKLLIQKRGVWQVNDVPALSSYVKEQIEKIRRRGQPDS